MNKNRPLNFPAWVPMKVKKYIWGIQRRGGFLTDLKFRYACWRYERGKSK